MFLRLCLLLVVAVAAATSQDERPPYSAKYDNVDVEEILRSDRLLKNYFNCLMEEGPCTPDGLELRSK